MSQFRSIKGTHDILPSEVEIWQMIEKNIRVNNEFYVCPVYNEAIQDDKKIKISHIEFENMWGLGTPEDLKYFIDNYK